LRPQFLEIGQDAAYLFSQTLLHDKINWPVSDGLNRAGMMQRYHELFPNAASPADFQTALAYGAGAILEKIVNTAAALEPARLKQTALDLNGKITVLTGPYQIEANGRQTKMEFVIMQNQKTGPEVVYPPQIKTAEPILSGTTIQRTLILLAVLPDSPLRPDLPRNASKYAMTRNQLISGACITPGPDSTASAGSIYTAFRFFP
jgi:hypothetical protein